MICPTCRTALIRDTKGGPMISNRGLLLKGGRIVVICPKCKGDVPATPEVMKSLQQVAVLFFAHSPRSPESG